MLDHNSCRRFMLPIYPRFASRQPNARPLRERGRASPFVGPTGRRSADNLDDSEDSTYARPLRARFPLQSPLKQFAAGKERLMFWATLFVIALHAWVEGYMREAGRLQARHHWRRRNRRP